MSISTIKQRDKGQLAVAALIASGAIKVTRCPDGLTPGHDYLRRRFGGIMPGHLNPVTMEDVSC